MTIKAVCVHSLRFRAVIGYLFLIAETSCVTDENAVCVHIHVSENSG